MSGGWGPGRLVAVCVAAALLLGFAGGFWAGRTAPSHSATASTGGFAWLGFGRPRAANAPRAGEGKPDGFAVWKTRIETSGADPLSCVRMSQPLDPSRSYADYVLVSPSLGHPVATTVRGDELCVAGLGFSGHKLTLLKGFPGRGGAALADNVDVDFSAADQPPYVGFDGLGVILPRQESDGIGIDTVNVSRLHIEVWREIDRNLVRQAVEAPEPTPEGEYSDEDDNGARRVWTGDVAVTAPSGQRAVTVFPLGAVLKAMKPGAYLITASDASGVLGARPKPGEEGEDLPARARRWVLFTDMGLAAYDGADALDVVARSLQTAKALPGIRIALVARDGEELAARDSDGEGHVRFDHALLEGEGAAKAVRVMAYGPRADFTLLDLERSPIDLSSQLKGETGRTPAGSAAAKGRGAAAAAAVDAYLYADRGVYRPGESVHLVGLVRDRLSHAVKDRPGALVIRRPSGSEFSRIRFTRTPDGDVAQDLALPKTAPRGLWKAELLMDGADDPSGAVSFDVEDFAPQRLAVEVKGDAARPVAAGERRAIQINARFLYGAPGSGLDAEAEARIGPDPNPFSQYQEFRWGDEQTAFESKLVQLPKTTTDGQGAARVNFDAGPVADATQPLKAAITASVLEPGGRPVTEAVTLKVRPKPLYLGVKVDSGGGEGRRVQTYEVIAVNAAGARVAAPKVAYTLIAENWSYDWFEKDGRWGYHRTSHDSPIATGVIGVPAAHPARISRRLSWGDYRLELQDPATGARTVIRQSNGWGDAASSDEDAPDTARLAVDDKPYAPGDTIQLHIQAPFGGEAEIAVASDHVIALHTARIDMGGSVVALHTDPRWGGGAYLLVSVMQPRDPATAPKPRRALGVAYVALKPAKQILTVKLGAPAKLDSRAPVLVPVQVSGMGGAGRAHVTVAAVDEGILRLTHQAAPDPVKWYFGRKALKVDYRDDYGRLLNANLGAPAAVNYGGDAVGGAGLTTTPIKTVALWSGVVETDASGRARIRLPPGDYNGQLRVMAVAWTDQAIGGGQAQVLVREPVVADLDLPRFLAPGDRAEIGLELHNVEGRLGAYLARVTAQGGLASAFQHLYQLALGQRVLDHLTLAAPNRPGVGSVALTVTGPGFSTTKRYPLQTRLGWSAVTRTTTTLQKPGEAYTPTQDLLRGMAAGDVTLTVSYSPFRGLDPAPIAAALDRYPYGCSEQLVSTAYPLLYAQELTSDPRLRHAPATLNATVGRLLDREGLDGAFGLWRAGDAEADAWLGAYIVDFLLEAKAHGAVVPDEALRHALHGMRMISRPDATPSIDYELSYPDTRKKGLTERMRSRAAAYALYDLAKAGQGDLPRLRWYHDQQFKDEPSPLARAQVGAALAMMGDRARAHDSFVQAAAALGYREDGDWYQSRLRDLAGVIALAYEAGETGMAHALQGRLEGAVKDPDALNTQEQARLLQAAHAMLAEAGPTRINAAGAQVLGGSRWAVGRLAAAHFVNAGRGALWRTVSVHGEPLNSPRPDGEGLSLHKQYFGFDGRPLDPSRMTQGQRVIIKLSGATREARAMQIVLDDPLPAGFEIESTLRPADADASPADQGRPHLPKGPYAFLGKLTETSLQDKRDDRYVAVLTAPGQTAFAVAYVARAVTPGNFFLPGAAGSDMYRPSIAAHTAAGRVAIARAR